jgi:hypothetical protein
MDTSTDHTARLQRQFLAKGSRCDHAGSLRPIGNNEPKKGDLYRCDVCDDVVLTPTPSPFNRLGG